MALIDTNSASAALPQWLKQSLGNRDVAFAIGVVMILGMLFIPLPPVLLDFGLAVSLSLAVLILMVALWIQTPLDFNSFPTLLLVVTMLRLALNVSSTRLILSNGHEGTSAAGKVIEGFAGFIVGGDYVIGIVIFAILVTINFIVITKGSTRIAEVAARFSLDAMPGKQMAIDADLGAGIIGEDEARARRKVLEEESSFFGAMDGASKFVRGDAVAGIIITLINVIGGILIGMTSHSLSVSQAATNYTVLTIGDGLITQIPALVVSLAAGLLVTKGSTRGATNEAVLSQLGNFPKALYLAAGLSFVVGFLPGFPVAIFVPLAAAMAGTGYLMQQRNAARALQAEAETSAEQPEQSPEEVMSEMLRVDDIRLDMATGLVPLINSNDAALPGKVKSLRNLFISDYGFVLPPVRIKDDPTLPKNTYAICLQGVETARGEVRRVMMMVIDPSGAEIDLPGEKTREPTFGLNAVWVDETRASEAEMRGLTVVDPESVITTHLTEVIKEHMPEILTYSATQELIEAQPKEYQKLLSDSSSASPGVLLQHVLQSLLSERVSIRNLPRIIEAVAEASATTQNLRKIIEHVRTKLAKQICQSMVDGQGYVPVITIGGDWDRELTGSISSDGNDEESFLMSPQRVQEFVLAVRQEIQKFSGGEHWPALLVAPSVRPYVRSILERVSPMTAVISHNEVHRKASLRTVGNVGGTSK